MIEFVVIHDMSLVVLDALTTFAGRRMSSDAAEREWAEPLKEIAERTGACVLGIHHLVSRPNAKVPVIDQLLGSGGGFLAVCRFAFLVGVHPDDEDMAALIPVEGTTQPLGPTTPMAFHLHYADYKSERDGRVITRSSQIGHAAA